MVTKMQATLQLVIKDNSQLSLEAELCVINRAEKIIS